MTRALGILGFSGGFLAISPKLRELLMDQFAFGVSALERHSPYSYVALGAFLLAGCVFHLYRGAAPR